MKIVNLQITVPSGGYCWDKEICQYFKNEDGHTSCEMRFGDVKFDGTKYLKPHSCKILEVWDEIE